MSKLYYTPPEEELFQEVKAKAMELWVERYPEDKNPFYAKEKVDRIKDIENIEDNFMYIVAMFDIQNQMLLASKLSIDAQDAIAQRMKDGGTPRYAIPFYCKEYGQNQINN